MSKVTTTYTLEMTEDEAVALKKLLGSFSDIKKKELGLTSEQCKSTSVIFDSLPYDNDE